MNYETAKEIELAVAEYFDPRRNLIVPNVYYGMGLNYECDIFVLTKVGYAYEIEIKISRSDLRADMKKRHAHGSKTIRRLYFAIPERLRLSDELIPKRAGILIVNRRGSVEKFREAGINQFAQKLNEKERLKLAELGTMRIWDLKKEIIKGTPWQEVMKL